jgi:EAL domain-containing protein (putative c-di-GMP-specific phosphodiesterase class I)/GGDEF domain-containing protein/PAS domain-containing protein
MTGAEVSAPFTVMNDRVARSDPDAPEATDPILDLDPTASPWSIIGRPLNGANEREADLVFRATLDSLHQAVYLYRPIWSGVGADRTICDLEILFCNRAALDQPLAEGVVAGTYATDVFQQVQLALDDAQLAWTTGRSIPYTIQRDGIRDGVEQTARYEMHTQRVANYILQTSADEARSRREKTAAEQRFTTTIESLSEGIGIWDPVRDSNNRTVDFVLCYRNPALAQFAPIGARASDFVSDVDLLVLGRTAGETNGQPATVNVTTKGAGRAITWRVSVVQVDGQVVSVLTDISAVQDVLARLAASEKLLSNVLDSLSESVRVFDADGALEYANVASNGMLGPHESSADGVSHPYTLADAGGVALDSDQYPLARGLRGEHVGAEVVMLLSDGRAPRVCNMTVTPLFETGSPRPNRIVVSASDITMISTHATELEWLATHRQQTGLMNLVGFLSTVEARAANGRGSYAVIWVNLAQLSTIRATFGFAVGDAVLVAAAAQVSAVAQRCGGLAAQTGDYALAIVLPDIASGNAVQLIANELNLVMSHPFDTGTISLLVGPTVGYAIGPLQGPNGDTVIRRAKTAAWHADKSGVHALRWQPELDADQVDRISLLGEFQRALCDGELFLEFQPKFDAAGRHFAGAEALVRWMHPTRGRLNPDSFIEAVEASTMCRPFTLWVIRAALTQWKQIADLYPGSKVAVNVPVDLISDLEFLEQLAEELVDIGLGTSTLQIEITERGLAGSIDALQAGLDQIAALGISIALDDFGTGQSSLAYVRTLTLDEVKIDRAFITNLHNDVANQAIVTACVAIAANAGMSVCAEGVETIEELDAATDLGCDVIQGFLLGKPMSLAALLIRLAGPVAA